MRVNLFALLFLGIGFYWLFIREPEGDPHGLVELGEGTVRRVS